MNKFPDENALRDLVLKVLEKPKYQHIHKGLIETVATAAVLNENLERDSDGASPYQSIMDLVARKCKNFEPMQNES